MKSVIALAVTVSLGCGTILNSGTARITPPQGATVDGQYGPIEASQKRSHHIVYADGRTCVVESGVSAGYVIADVVFWFLLGLVVDGVTGNWKTLDEEACPGVIVD
ncbi:MAG: hypothetical protein JNL83_21295 [Myxococcales bacterium]|nr:hypothetical protein [Myxococcales bacterium]